jgi:SAM-dependent methyltransferase
MRGLAASMLRFSNNVKAKLGVFLCSDFPRIAKRFSTGNGLEIGGPSTIFEKNNVIPLYPIVKSLDNCNFSSATIWSHIPKGRFFEYNPGSPLGYQHITDAVSLNGIESQTYDFILASHVLEHIANPLKALHSWSRVLKNNGSMLIVLPYKDYTFDHYRQFTDFNHIKEDFEKNTQEDDLSHLEEILHLHDFEMDCSAGTKEQFRDRSLHNLENRCLHHHVFSPEIMPNLFASIGMRLDYLSIELPCHLIGIGVPPIGR